MIISHVTNSDFTDYLPVAVVFSVFSFFLGRASTHVTFLRNCFTWKVLGGSDS